MEAGTQSPLLDVFRRGEVGRDVRLDAARGAIAPRALEQLALLALLVGDADPEVRDAAEATLAAVPRDRIAGQLARADAPPDLRAFFAARGVEPAGTADTDGHRPLVGDAPDTADDGADADEPSLLQRIAAMTVPDRVKAAMRGSREMRAVLVRDPNKLVALAVLSSPKMTDSEVEAFARMGSVGEDVLRAIARNRSWLKTYGIVLALVRNAKTPVATSMPLLGRLNAADLKRLSSDRNIPEPLRLAARRRVAEGER